MAINNLSSFTPTQSTFNLNDTANAGAGSRSGGQFASMLNNYIKETNAVHNEGVAKSTALVTGQGGSMTEAMLAMQKAEVSFQLLTSSRNKLLDAYREVMRMPV
ncbi:MAG: flagellar hook-basal body complex protein FliE [Zetaproteobacteria bacterium]|nr:flagellar hook-basal body complex protein FliE [Zetaproteobacteria bacterium]